MSHQEFAAVLQAFDAAMLVTRRGLSLRSRPMTVAAATDAGKIWFLSNATSGKLDELAAHPEVNVAFQKGGKFLSLTGTARVVTDRDKIRELWSEDHRPWFPGGPEDPDLILIEVLPEVAEYWDRSGIKGVLYALAEAEAVAAGRALSDGAGAHDKLKLD